MWANIPTSGMETPMGTIHIFGWMIVSDFQKKISQHNSKN